MLNKSFGVIYFHFNFFSKKKKQQKKQMLIFIILSFKSVSESDPKHTTFKCINVWLHASL